MYILINLLRYCVIRYVDLLATNGYLVDYIDVILRNERISMTDSVILNFMEIYLPKVCG